MGIWLKENRLNLIIKINIEKYSLFEKNIEIYYKEDNIKILQKKLKIIFVLFYFSLL